jgi:hypothetical protein
VAGQGVAGLHVCTCEEREGGQDKREGRACGCVLCAPLASSCYAPQQGVEQPAVRAMRGLWGCTRGCTRGVRLLDAVKGLYQMLRRRGLDHLLSNQTWKKTAMHRSVLNPERGRTSDSQTSPDNVSCNLVRSKGSMQALARTSLADAERSDLCCGCQRVVGCAGAGCECIRMIRMMMSCNCPEGINGPGEIPIPLLLPTGKEKLQKLASCQNDAGWPCLANTATDGHPRTCNFEKPSTLQRPAHPVQGRPMMGRAGAEPLGALAITMLCVCWFW